MTRSSTDLRQPIKPPVNTFKFHAGCQHGRKRKDRK